MPDPDALFRSYLERRDPALLAEVFDVVAPRLLRLAIHLVGRVSQAEDLVQDTFVTALERLGGFDANRAVEPWLAGILSNKARHTQRDAARSFDPELHMERATATPLDEAQRAELSGILAQAIDRLSEPYRSVLVLRLRHGMRDADIAHVLERSPATVRVQLHRGLELLRRLLPAGSCALLVAPAELARGFAAMREVVLSKASAVPAAVSPSAILGGVLVAKKTVFVLAVAAALLLVTRSLLRSIDPRDSVHPSDSSAEPGGAAIALLSAPYTSSPVPEVVDVATAAGNTESRREVAAPPMEPARASLVGRVIDAVSEEPLAQAKVALYAPRTMTLSALKVAEWERIAQRSWDGSLRPTGIPFARTTAPDSEGRQWEQDTALFDAEPIVVYDHPSRDAQPLATAVADEQGRFTLDFPPVSGTLVADFPGYESRAVPAEQAAGDWTLALRKATRIEGVVESADGPVGGLALLLFGVVGEKWEPDPKGGGAHIVPSWDSWPVVTSDDGSFEVEVSADKLQVHVQTPGWFGGGVLVTGKGRQRAFVSRAPVLRVRDTTTMEGVEHFTLVARELQNGYVRFAGRFYAPGGVHSMFEDRDLMSMFRNMTLELTVCAEGYLGARFTSTDLPSKGDVTIELQRGEAPSLRGVIRDGGTPLAGARVALQPYGRMQWDLEHERSISAAVTPEDGSFRVSSSAGDYILRVQYGERVYAEEVTLPDDAERFIDFAALGCAEVSVVDAEGTPQAAYTVVLRSDRGRSQWDHTGPDGVVRFMHLPDGPFRVNVPRVAAKGSFGDPLVEAFDIAAGGTTLVRVTVPVQGRRCYPRVVTNPPSDLTGWRARTPSSSGSDGEWKALMPDGTVPIDIALVSWRRVEVAHPDGRRWSVDVPATAQDGYEIAIALEGRRYAGTLLDHVSGEPLSGVRVQAQVTGVAAAVSATCVTDASGRFSLVCDRNEPYWLMFHSSGDRPTWDTDGTEYEGVGFIPAEPPLAVPLELTLRLPRRAGAGFVGLATRRVAGEVVRQESREPVPGARVGIFARREGQGGAITLWTPTMTALTQSDGAYALSMPEADLYHITVCDVGSTTAVLTEEWRPEIGEDPRVLAIP